MIETSVTILLIIDFHEVDLSLSNKFYKNGIGWYLCLRILWNQCLNPPKCLNISIADYPSKFMKKWQLIHLLFVDFIDCFDQNRRYPLNKITNFDDNFIKE